MNGIFEIEAWREILVKAFTELATNLAGFLPNLFGAALILLLGWGLARILEAVASRLLRTLGLDRASSRLGLADLLERAELDLTLSGAVARLLFWMLLLVFVLSSVETLGLEAVRMPIDRVIAFIPVVIGSALIGVVGLLLARFVGTLVSSGLAAADVEAAPRLGYLAQVLVGALVLVAAIQQLGIDTNVLLLPLTVLLATAGLATGLAFALGARRVVTHILAGHFLKQSLPRDTAVEIEGRRGMVERVGAVDTVLRGDDGAWSIPNARLLEKIVDR